MNFESFLAYDHSSVDQLRLAVNRAARVGYQGVVLTVDVSTVRRHPPPPDPLPLAPAAAAAVARRAALHVLGDFPRFPQFTRLNLCTDSAAELQQLPRALSDTAYDLISVTPLSDAAFRAACSAADVDIVSLDARRYLPLACWKELKALVNRGVAIELRYSDFLRGGASLRQFVRAAQSAAHATRGRRAKDRVLLLGCGSDDPDMVRGPADVRSLAALVGIPHSGALTGDLVKRVIARGLARRANAGTVRRLRALPAEDDDALLGFDVVTD